MQIETKPRCDAPKDISYGAIENPEMGNVFVAWSGDALLYLGLCNGLEGLKKLEQFFPNAYLKEDNTSAVSVAADIFKAWRLGSDNLSISLYGTPFQIKVWKALLEIPMGETVSYETIAKVMDNPKAVRAVGTAVGQNPISLLVPCHRVLPKSGGVGNYLWGSDLKKNLLAMENVVQAA